MSNFMLKLIILMKLSKGEKHTVNSLSKTLRQYRNVIYQSHSLNQKKTLKELNIPKIDITHALKDLKTLKYVTQHTTTPIFKEGNKIWKQKKNVFTATEQGKQTYNTIKQLYNQIETLLTPKNTKTPKNPNYTI